MDQYYNNQYNNSANNNNQNDDENTDYFLGSNAVNDPGFSSSGQQQNNDNVNNYGSAAFDPFAPVDNTQNQAVNQDNNYNYNNQNPNQFDAFAPVDNNAYNNSQQQQDPYNAHNTSYNSNDPYNTQMNTSGGSAGRLQNQNNNNYEQGYNSDATEEYEPDNDEMYGDSPIKAPPYPYPGSPGHKKGKRPPNDGPGPYGASGTSGTEYANYNANQLDDVDLYKTPEQQRIERYEKLEAMAFQYEQALRICGHGRWQWMLFFILGFGLMADGVEIFIAGFVLPAAEKDMCSTTEVDNTKGWMSKWAFIGMMLGAIFWGPASDQVGRRSALLVCLSISAFSSCFSAFVGSKSFFMFCRFISSFNVGGAIPIIFAFWSELLPREKRSEHISWMAMFWMIGGVYGSLMAYWLIPSHGWSFYMGENYNEHSWRMFVVICSLPCLTATALLTMIPESPRWLLEMGRKKEAMEVLALIHQKNNHGGQFDVDIEAPDPVDELIEISESTKRIRNRVFVRALTSVQEAFKKYLSIIVGEDQKVGKTSFKLWTIMFALSFSYYGVGVWVPDEIKEGFN